MFFSLWFETSNVLLWNVGQILWLHHRWCLNEMISFLKLIGQEVPLSWFDFRRFKSSDWSIDQFEAPSDILQYCACNSAFWLCTKRCWAVERFTINRNNLIRISHCYRLYLKPLTLIVLKHALQLIFPQHNCLFEWTLYLWQLQGLCWIIWSRNKWHFWFSHLFLLQLLLEIHANLMLSSVWGEFSTLLSRGKRSN